MWTIYGQDPIFWVPISTPSGSSPDVYHILVNQAKQPHHSRFTSHFSITPYRFEMHSQLTGKQRNRKRFLKLFPCTDLPDDSF